jgi:thiamine-phosphate pyrophosphorylase
MPTRLDLGVERRARLAAARLYLVCDSRPGGRELSELLPAAIAGGVDIVQLRDKRLSKDELADVAHDAARLCRRLGVLFIVNDHPQLALEAGADGVHVGQQDMPIGQARALVGAELLIGLSTHEPTEIDAVAAQHERARDAHGDVRAAGDNLPRVDYIGVGPVHTTPTKPGRAPTGLSLVSHAAAVAQLPFFAIGGVHAGNAAAVIGAGARRLAVVRAIAEALDPERAARELRALLDA